MTDDIADWLAGYAFFEMEGAAREDDSGLLTVFVVGLAAEVVFAVFFAPVVLDAYCYKDGWDADEFCCFFTTFDAAEDV